MNNIKYKSDYIALKVYMHDINHNKASLIKKIINTKKSKIRKN